ncbi:MAG: SRPBCC domain-containing protein, partial [Dehalococcoidia bacterium]
MTEPATGTLATTLRLNRTYPAPRELVFSAWTDPERVKHWWGVEPGYSTPIVEIDLRVGGRYRL